MPSQLGGQMPEIFHPDCGILTEEEVNILSMTLQKCSITANNTSILKD